MYMKRYNKNLKKEEMIYEIFKKNNGYVKTEELLGNGVHPRDIKKLVSEGVIIRLKNGVYRLKGIPFSSNRSFIDVFYAIKESVVCLLSALSFYELTDFVPSYVDVAIPRGMWKPRMKYPPVRIHYFSGDFYKKGIVEYEEDEMKFRIYTVEKTICDIFRYGNRIGKDIIKESLRRYLNREDRNLELLFEYSKVCKVESVIKRWIEAMI